MGASTVYDVRVKYVLDDKASKQIGAIGTSAQRAARGVGGLRSGLRSMVAVAAGGFGFRLAKSVLIDYNASLEQSRQTMSGLLMLNLGGSWAKNTEKATALINQFRDDAKASAGTMKDMVDFASLITGPVTRAGLSMEQLRSITKGGVVAAKAFGIEADVAARDIEQALLGTVSNKDRFFKALMGPMDMTTKQWNEMVRKTPQKAAQMLVDAFDQPAIKEMAKSYETSWAGVTSTLKDNFQRVLGQVGLPLMQEIGKEIGNWNKWFDNNKDAVRKWAKDMAQSLVGAFRTAKKVIGFLVDHKDLLLKIARAYIIFKGVGFLAGGLLGGAQGIQGFIQNLQGTGGPLKAMAGNLNLAVAGLAGLAVVADAVAQGILERQEKNIKAEQETITLRESSRKILFAQTDQEKRFMKLRGVSEADFRTLAARELRREAKGLDIIGAGGEINTAALGKAFGLTGQAGQQIAETLVRGTAREKEQALTLIGDPAIGISKFLLALEEGDKLIAQQEQRVKILGGAGLAAEKHIKGAVEFLGVAAAPIEMLANASFQVRANLFQPLYDDIATLGEVFRDSFIDPIAQTLGIFGRITGAGEEDVSRKPKTQVNVNISKIQVQTSDPDRFAFGLSGAFDNVQHNPTQARRLWPGARRG